MIHSRVHRDRGAEFTFASCRRMKRAGETEAQTVGLKLCSTTSQCLSQFQNPHALPERSFNDHFELLVPLSLFSSNWNFTEKFSPKRSETVCFKSHRISPDVVAAECCSAEAMALSMDRSICANCGSSFSHISWDVTAALMVDCVSSGICWRSMGGSYE